MKKRQLILLILLLVTYSVFSQKKYDDKSFTDSLVNQWNVRFNSDIPNNISEILTKDIIMVSGEDRFISRDSVMENFVKARMPVVSDIKAINEFYSVSNTMIFTAGIYTLKVSYDGKEPFNSLGNYTLIWKKENDKKYRIAYIHIESVKRL